MTLTKRLYRIDEVRSALLYSIKMHRVDDAMFWLQEMEDSCYGREARRLLCVAWLMFVGLSRIAWLQSWANESLSEEGRRKLCLQLSKSRQTDSSIWWLLCSIPATIDSVKGLSNVFDNWRSTWYTSEEEFWQPHMDWVDDERIETIFESLQNDMSKYTVFARCIACMIRGLYKSIPTASWEAKSETPTKIQFTGNIRKDRVYAIPYDCLFGMTWRGTGADTTDELRSLDFQKSPWWRTLVEGIDESDESKEMFYDAHFHWVSCDIPDEWSREDQRKSHGPGVSHPSASLERWWRNWIVSKSLFPWGKLETSILDWVKQQPGNTGISFLDRVLQSYKELQDSQNSNQLNSTIKVNKEFILSA